MWLSVTSTLLFLICSKQASKKIYLVIIYLILIYGALGAQHCQVGVSEGRMKGQWTLGRSVRFWNGHCGPDVEGGLNKSKTTEMSRERSNVEEVVPSGRQKREISLLHKSLKYLQGVAGPQTSNLQVT